MNTRGLHATLKQQSNNWSVFTDKTIDYEQQYITTQEGRKVPFDCFKNYLTEMKFLLAEKCTSSTKQPNIKLDKEVNNYVMF